MTADAPAAFYAASPPAYGAAPAMAPVAFKPNTSRRSPKLNMFIMNVAVPWILFIVVYSILCFNLRAASATGCYWVSAIIGVAALGIFYPAWNSTSDNEWYWLLAVSCVVAWICAVACGEHNFQINMLPFNDLSRLTTYTDVDPAQYRGNQLMDAGQIIFRKGTTLDLSKSMSFKNGVTYCVVPISSRDMAGQSNATYDFWAIGTDCCSHQQGDYKCGGYDNPLAKAGLRLMHEDQRQFFRLAVEQAEAKYSITVAHPIFLHWVQDSTSFIKGLEDQGYKMFVVGFLVFFGWQFFITLFFMLCFT